MKTEQEIKSMFVKKFGSLTLTKICSTPDENATFPHNSVRCAGRLGKMTFGVWAGNEHNPLKSDQIILRMTFSLWHSDRGWVYAGQWNTRTTQRTMKKNGNGRLARFVKRAGEHLALRACFFTDKGYDERKEKYAMIRKMMKNK